MVKNQIFSKLEEELRKEPDTTKTGKNFAELPSTV